MNDLNVNPYLLSFSVEDKRLVAFKDGRARTWNERYKRSKNDLSSLFWIEKDEWDESE